MTHHPPARRLVDTDERSMNAIRIYLDAEPGQKPWPWLVRMRRVAQSLGGEGYFVGYRRVLPPLDRRFHVE